MKVDESPDRLPQDGGVLGRHFEATMPSLLSELVDAAPERTILSTIAGDDLTVRELSDRAHALAGGFASLGAGRGDRVAAMLTNGFELVEAFFAATLLGCVFVPLNTAWRRRSLQHILDDSESRVLVVEPTFYPEVEKYAATATYRPQIVVTGTDRPPAGAIGFDQLRASAPARSPAELGADDLGMLLYTSGTTGLSKGNMLSHRASLWMAATAASTLGYRSDDIVHSCLPLFHANALQCGLLGAFLRGARFVISPRFTASGFWRELAGCGATHTALLGSMMPLLTARPAAAEDRGHRVRVAYCAPLPDRLAEFEARFDLKCASTYGLTDANIFTVRPADESGVNSCGTASPDWDLALVDNDDRPVARGKVGELVGRPRLPSIASAGYWRNPTATAELWRNLWCHSGDLLRQDDDGRFHFVDRKKDAIRKGGENVSTFEVEEALLAHSAIDEAAVFGVPSELSEDDVMAVLVVADGNEVSAEEIFGLCARELPFFAVPRYIEFATELPRTENHRIRKADLRAAGVTAATWDAGPLSRRRIAEASER